MAEAMAIIGLASAIATLIETGTRVVHRLKEAKDSGSLFAEVADQLPLLLEVVKELQEDLKGSSMDPYVNRALSRTVEGCLRQANMLGALLEKSTSGAYDSKMQRIRKTIGGIRNESKVREIQRILETYKTTLMLHLGQSAMKGINIGTQLKPDEFCHIPASQISYFVGREELLGEIDLSLLPAMKEPYDRQITVLHGMGGQGKTQLALEYCRRAKAHGNFLTIIWIDSTSPNTVRNDFEHVAERLAGKKNSFPNSEAKISFVKAELEHWSKPWLLVFDSLDQPGAFQNIQDYFPGGSKGALLFTSRHTDLGRLGTTIPVTAMSEIEGLDLLLHQCNLNKTDEIAREGTAIVRELSYLPLAIDQAGSYIRSRRLALQNFPEHYKNRKAFVLQHTPQLWEYQKKLGQEEHASSLSVFTTWELSYDQVGYDGEQRTQLGHILTLSAFFDNTNVSEDLYQNIIACNTNLPSWTDGMTTNGRWDRYKFQDMTADLLANSLIQSISFEGETLSFTLHPLVRDWIRLRLNQLEQKQYTIEAITTLAAIIEMSSRLNSPVFLKSVDIIPHINASMENDKMFLNGDVQLGQGFLTNAGLLFASCYNLQGHYRNAETLFQRTVESQTKELGAQHPEISRTLMNLANVYRNLGEFSKAEALYKRVLATRQNLLGPGHLDTLRPMEGLAAIKASQGDYTEAEKILTEVLAGRENQLGPDDPESLSIVERLADVCRHQGLLNIAEELYERTLRTRTKALGPEHPDTLRSAEGLAIVFRTQSRYQEAIDIYEGILKHRKTIFGPGHPSSLQTGMNIAIASAYQGSYDTAEQLTKSALEGYENRLGHHHPSTQRAVDQLRKIHDLAVDHRHQRKPDQLMQTVRMPELEELPTDGTAPQYFRSNLTPKVVPMRRLNDPPKKRLALDIRYRSNSPEQKVSMGELEEPPTKRRVPLNNPFSNQAPMRELEELPSNRLAPHYKGFAPRFRESPFLPQSAPMRELEELPTERPPTNAASWKEFTSVNEFANPSPRR